MNSTIQTSVPKAKEVKSLEVVKATPMKTKVKLEIRTDDKAFDETVYLQSVASDVKLLGIGGEPLTDIMWAIEGAAAIGRIVNRARRSFIKLDLELSALEWSDSAGVVTLKSSTPLYGNDLPIISEILFRLVNRACAPLGATEHPLTIYDLKQAMGLIYDMKQEGEIGETGETIDRWMAIREEAHLEEEKAARAAARTAKKKADKAVAEAKTPNPTKPKAKAKPKPKTGAKTASLTSFE
jgi:hypothetical protein